jgi:hypothetical protein
MKVSRFLFLSILLFQKVVEIHAQLPTYLPTNGLVAWYPFNGNANDESGNNHHCIVSGATLIPDRFNEANRAYLFNGAVPSSITCNIGSIKYAPFTISMWVKPTTTITLASESNQCPNTSSYGMYQNNQNWALLPDNGGNTQTGVGLSVGTNSIQTAEHAQFLLESRMTHQGQFTQPTHIAIVYKTDSSFLYVNGVKVRSRSLGCISTQKFLSSNLQFGSSYTSPNFSGSIDDIGVWNRNLSSAEINSLFNAANTNTGGSGTTTSVTPSPPGIPYQAEVRNESGEVLANANVNVRFTLHELTANGTISYQETHTLTTNEIGLFAATIGAGTATQGTFAGINWSQTTKFLQVEVDAGNGYNTMGNQQLMSVPYALYAANGPAGPQGPAGEVGQPGTPGANGLSAYEIWLEQGNNGTESDFLNSLPNGSSSIHGSFQGTNSGIFIIPSNVNSIELSMSGSIGGSGGTAIGLGYNYGGGIGGNYGFTRLTVPVNTGDTIQFQIGNNGTNGGNCLATGSCGNSPGCNCVAGSGTQGEITTLKLNGLMLFQISGGAGGTGGSYGLINAFGNPGSQGVVNYSIQSLSSGIIPLTNNIWNIDQRSILIRY